MANKPMISTKIWTRYLLTKTERYYLIRWKIWTKKRS